MTDATTRTYVGTATSASEDGSVYVALSQDVTLPDDDDGTHGLGVEMPTTVNVDEGDEVIVTVFGGGTMKSPVVTGNPGWGDTVQTQVDNAETLAQQAEAEVEQVRQDVADFRDDVATTYATKVEREDGDDAVKTWVTTNYTNSNDLATTYATKTLVSQTKDAIELSASQTYETQSDAAATYATKAALTVGLNGIRTEVAEDYQPKGDYATTASMNSAIQQSASSIESSVAATYETKSDAAATYATKTDVTQTVSGLDTRITTAQSTADGAYLERSGTGTTIDTTGAATIRSLTIHGQSVQDGTPSPSVPVPIVSVESRNLLDASYFTSTASGQTYYSVSGDVLTVLGSDGRGWATMPAFVLPAGTYALSRTNGSGATYVKKLVNGQPTAGYALTLPDGTLSGTFTLSEATTVAIRLGYNAASYPFDVRIQLERGTTAHPYQPYGCVTLVAGSTRTDIDLQGHALRSLPDGTHDEMAVDSLGRVTMTQRVGVTAQATTDGISATVGTDAMSTTGDLRDGATVIYPLATPQTINLGTIDLPAPANTLWLDAALVPTMGATWWTVDGIAGQQALEAEATERQTLIRQFSGGVLAGYVGNAIAALVNAAGSFDVVRTAWSGGVPSILSTLATFGANLIRIGEETGQNVLITSAGQLFRNGLNNLLALVAGTAHSETFTVESYVYDPTYSYMATHTIGVEHIAIQSVIFDGSEFPKFSATTRRGWVYKKSTNLLSLRFHQSDSALGKQVTVNYRTFASMAIYDGTGNDAENIAASFSADDIMLGGSIDGDVDDDKASIRFFGGSVDTETTYIDASGGIGTSSVTGDPCYLNREIMLGNIVTDSRLYDDSGRRANGFVSFAQSISDSYNTGGETTSSYVNSYVSMYSGTNNVANYAAITATSVDNLLDSSTSDTETYTEVSARADRLRLEDTSGDAIIPMEQAIAVLSSPVTLFTGTYAQTHSAAVTLSESAANFSRLLFVCENNDGERTSVTVTDPNGKYFNVVMVTMAGPTGTGTYAYMKAKSFSINGTSVTCRTYTYNGQTIYRHGSVTLRNGVAVSATQTSEEIGIVKVLGWR